MNIAEKEIEVGEYVRTKFDGIKKVDAIFENKTVNKYGTLISDVGGEKEYKLIKESDITKHSFNIIDLIEEGDYVNGNRVIEKRDKSIILVDSEYSGNFYIENEHIKRIVTHEQFKSLEYEVK